VCFDKGVLERKDHRSALTYNWGAETAGCHVSAPNSSDLNWIRWKGGKTMFPALEPRLFSPCHEWVGKHKKADSTTY